MRKLASIRQIGEIFPIEGRDRIVLAMIDGWSVIVKKDEFKTGDLCVYCEIDSVLPEKPEFEFLRSKGFRIKTMKLGQTYSQGICFPMDVLPEGKYELGQDVTDIIGVTQYEPTMDKEPTPSEKSAKKPKYPKWLMRWKWFRALVRKKDGGKESRGFPSFISKTDETRCLIGNTKIETDKGKIRIADIVNKRLNVKVKSYDPSSNSIVYKDIVSYQKYEDGTQHIELVYPKRAYHDRTNKIVCTPDHKVMSTNMQYRRADELHPGDTLYYSETCYEDSAIPAIYGMLLGDSMISIDRRHRPDGTASRIPRLSIMNGEAQLEYLLAKAQMLCGDNPKIQQTFGGWNTLPVYRANIPVDHTITSALYEDEALVDGKLVLTKRFCDRLTPLSFALWYMDDGCIRHADDDVASATIQISSNSFTYEEHLLLQNRMLEYGIHTNIRKEHRVKVNSRGDAVDKTYYSLYIVANDVPKFLKMITQYMPSCMRYKTIPELRGDEYTLCDIRYQKAERLIETTISSVTAVRKATPLTRRYTYDLEIADTHNFFANDVLHHNCQNAPFYLSMNAEWVLTEKVDGSSGTYAIVKHKRLFKTQYEFIVCSRNLRLYKNDGSNYWKVAEKYKIEEVLRDMLDKTGYDWIAIQGEVIAPNIQGNKYKVKEPDLYVFNLITPYGREGSLDGKKIIETYGMKWVPIVSPGATLPSTVSDMLELAHGESALGNTIREGLVCRTLDGKHSFKAVDPLFLIKYDA